MCILFCLGYAKLFKSKCRDVLSKCVRKRLRWEGDSNIRNRSIVLSHTDICDIFSNRASIESIKVRIYYCSCYLPCSIRSKVEHYYAVAIANIALAFAAFSTSCLNAAWHYKLIGFIFIICSIKRNLRSVKELCLTIYNSVICLLHSIKAIISIHCIVST